MGGGGNFRRAKKGIFKVEIARRGLVLEMSCFR